MPTTSARVFSVDMLSQYIVAQVLIEAVVVQVVRRRHNLVAILVKGAVALLVPTRSLVELNVVDAVLHIIILFLYLEANSKFCCLRCVGRSGAVTTYAAVPIIYRRRTFLTYSLTLNLGGKFR